MPRWVARLNRRVLNPLELERGRWPVLHHVGRVSGHEYRTPVGVVRLADGYAVVLVYGRRTEWLRNVLAAGECVLEIDGRHVPLTHPRIRPLAELEALGAVDAPSGRTERLLAITECLVLDARPGRA